MQFPNLIWLVIVIDLFLWHSGFHTINDDTQPALAALFVNGLSLEVSGLIKGRKKRWEALGLTGLVTIAEHFERIVNKGPSSCNHPKARNLK